MPLPFGGALLGALGGVVDRVLGRSAEDRNTRLQKEFAQNGIQWKVEDAKKAGIHPLYALGAPTMSFSPSSVGSDFAGVGQDLSRAIDATRSSKDRGQARLDALTLERAGLENDLLRSQIMGSKMALLRSNGPSMPSGNGNDFTDPIYWNGQVLLPGSKNSAAAVVQNAYGEGVGDAYGWVNFGDSFKQNVFTPWQLQQGLEVEAQKWRRANGLPTFPVGPGSRNSASNYSNQRVY